MNMRRLIVFCILLFIAACQSSQPDSIVSPTMQNTTSALNNYTTTTGTEGQTDTDTGGTTTPPTDNNHAPFIANLQLSPTSFNYYLGGEYQYTAVTVDYMDVDGDVQYFIVNTGQSTSHTSYINSSGTTGSFSISAQINTQSPGTYTLTITAYDNNGNNSNTLSGTYTINARNS